MRVIGYVAFLSVSSTLIFFTLLELFPSIGRSTFLNPIRYYALQDRYVSDPVLVFMPRRTGLITETSTKGDSYSPVYGIETETISFVATYDDDGFRKSSSEGPIELLIIGDSYIQVGETDYDTLAARVEKASGLSARNLGRSWYGPHQYVELLRRYAPSATTGGYALFCFFDGNDIRDIGAYRDWLEYGRYYDWRSPEHGFLRRYATVLRDLWMFTRRRAKKSFRNLRSTPVSRDSAEGQPTHPQLAFVPLSRGEVAMRFLYRHPAKWTDQLLASEEWRILRLLLGEFRDIANDNRLTPLVVFIPTKFQVYADQASMESGGEVLRRAELLTPFETSSASALAQITDELDIPLIDLLPTFKAWAGRGDLLYYPFDTHWNSTGRQAAAERIADWLANAKDSNP